MKLNLGCGVHALPGWVNLDLIDHDLVFKHDLSQGLPKHLEHNTVAYIYTEHFVEHITREQAVELLRDCAKVLKPGGRLRISTPDLMTLVADYYNGDTDRWSPGWSPKTTCQMMNEGMRAWGHQFLYDYAELARVCEEAGFKGIMRVQHRISEVKELSGLEIRPDYGDLIVEVWK